MKYGKIMMKKLFTALFLMMLVGKVSATAQIPDILIYKGETQAIFSNPLESYFGEQHPKPNEVFEFSCTSNWRGYIATWKIEEKALYLVKLVDGSCDENAPEIPITTLFPEQQAPILASWFSGVLRIPLGEELEYVHMGYGSIYEKELLLTIENGKLVGEEIIDNSKRELPSVDDLTIEELRKLKEWEDTKVLPK